MEKMEIWLEKHGVSAFWFKLLAIISMTIDHVGAVLFPNQIWMRVVGRFAFPIFCFFLVEGAYHTSNIRRYEGRLLAFALISEVPFDLALFGQLGQWQHQNVFFTLFFGLVTMDIFLHCQNKIIRILVFISSGLLCELLHTDYGIVGILFIVLFFAFHEDKRMAKGSVCLMNFAMYFRQIQMYASLACILLLGYNGKRGPSMRLFFYVYYPLHLSVLAFLVKKGITF
ncbi:TraX protein [Lachnospiraceae bacterium XBB1006]|nr:TraX protein [Lachnospiraceae bacterium XBB1006]